MYTPPGGKVNVNLTDTVSVWWYVAAVFVPVVGFIAGIVFMAKSKIGPAIALWATCFLAATFWAGVYAAIEYDRLTGDDTSIEETFGLEESTTEGSTEQSDVQAYSDCVENAVTADEIAAC